MLLPLFHSHSSLLLPKPQTDQSNPPFLFLFASLPLPKTSISQNPKPSKFLIRCTTSTPTTTTTTETLPKSAIQRIADKLRSLGYTDENPGNKTEPRTGHGHGSAGEIFVPLPQKLPKYRVGSTIDPSWSTPDNPVPEPGSGSAISRYHELRNVVESEKRLARKKEKEKEERVPTLAELSLKEGELRRLRGIGIKLKKKVKIGKAGITEGIVNGIHERWRRAEVVKLVCEDLCKLNMKRTHDLLERKTGGLVVWRSGSNIILYRGANYKYPYFLADNNSTTDNSHDASMNSGMDSARYGSQGSYLSSTDNIISAATDQSNKRAQSSLIQGVGSPNRVRFQLPGEAQLAEEADSLLDGLGPRFTDWWGYDPLPVDADLLPAVVPGYRRPFRLLPYGVKPKLTDDEMTILRRLGRPLPCHFALGRNRNLQGLAASIIKLWEKCEIAKIAIKRGVQNTNSDLMAEELKRLTGGTLLSRDSEFIVFYRGKDFLPSAVSSAIEERRKYGMHMDKSRMDSSVSVMTTDGPELRTTQHASEDILDGTNNQTENFLFEQRKLGTIEAGIKRTRTKLSMALEKKEEAEKLLAELGKAEMPQQLETDKEGITEEERYMLRKVGLRMKPFLLLGRRGVFAGTIENMHLHWKYRELVKILCQERRIEDVHGVARTLEAESGGILVAIERVSKGYAVIVYRGKNYTRPASLRPNTLLNKREAMKRSLEAQRRQSLKLHVLKLTQNIEDLKLQMAKDKEGSSMQSVDASTIQLVEERLGADSTTRNSNYGVDVSLDCLELNHQDKQIDFSSRCEDETVKAEPASSSKAIPLETEVFTHTNNDSGNVDSTSSPDNSLSPVRTTCSTSAIVNTVPRVLDITMESSVTSTGGKLESSTHGVVEDGSNGVNPRAVRLSNRERLLLRKQALKMKKRPVLAVGRSNIVTGVAKTIKAHFLKHPLAIVNVKGRAKGTSVQEVIFKLEQATGAVLVSQEPSKVVLYRGWGAGEERDHSDRKNLRETLEARGGLSRAAVSPELMAAIKLECGLQTNQEEEATL